MFCFDLTKKNILHISDFTQALSHNMNIVNVQENQLHIFVEIFAFITTPTDNIGHCIHFGSCIHNENTMTEKNMLKINGMYYIYR